MKVIELAYFLGQYIESAYWEGAPKALVWRSLATNCVTYLKDHALESPSIKLTRGVRQTFYIFANRCLEGEKAGLGEIPCATEGAGLSFFSSQVPSDYLNQKHKQSEHPFFEIEFLAVWVARELWAGTIRESYNVFYLDNEAAQRALIGCRSYTITGSTILHAIFDLEDDSRCRPRYGRVPSHSSPARRSGECMVLHGPDVILRELPAIFPPFNVQQDGV